MQVSATTIFAALAALAVVVCLVLLAGRAARATGLGRLATSQRLIVRESLALDRARRLQLISCDGRELLLLTGGSTDVVVGWIPSAGEVRP